MFKYLNEKAKKFGIVDTKLIQLGTLCLAAILFTYVPVILEVVPMYAWITVAVLAFIKPFITFFRK